MEIIKIQGEEWKLCDEWSHKYWCNNKKGFFGKGIINSREDPAKVTRIGLLGEYALSKYLKIKANFKYLEKGDREDLVFRGYRIDIKTASRDYGAALVRCISSRGNVVLKPEKMCDLYVAGYLKKERKEDEFAEIRFMGFLFKEQVRKLRPKKARVGDHKNYELEFGKLNSMADLLELKDKDLE